MTTEQKSHTASSNLDVVFKQLDTRWRRFAKYLNDDNLIYAWYALLDALNIAYSILKYTFELILVFKNKPTSSVAIVNAVHDWICTPIGLAVMIIETVALVCFFVMGSLFSEHDKSWIKRTIAILAPYVRDAWKAVKWAYRTWRSLLIATMTFTKTDIRYLLLPIGVGLGVIGLLNRIWSRSMKNERKEMIKHNTKLEQEVNTKGCRFHVLASLPSPMSPLYHKSYIYLQGYQLVLSEPQEDSILENTLSLYVKDEILYYAVLNQEGEIEEIEIKLSDLGEAYYQPIKTQLSQGEPLTEEQTEAIFKHTAKQGYTQNRGLYYINSEGGSELISLESFDKFEHEFKKIYERNFRELLRLKFPQLAFYEDDDEGGSGAVIQADPSAGLFILPSPPKDYQNLSNVIVYIQGSPDLDTEILYIDAQGKHHPVTPESGKSFEKFLKDIRKNNHLLGPDEAQLEALLHRFNHTKQNTRFTIEEWEAYQEQIEQELQTKGCQSENLQTKCYVSALIGGFIDGGYACLPPIGVTILIPPLFIAVAAFSGVMMLLFMAAKYYEEYEYQLKLEATKTKVELLLLEKKLDILLSEFTRISLLIAQAERATPDLLKKRKELLDALIQAKKEFDACRKKWKDQTVLTHFTALMRGLLNGLAAYGAVTSIMFAVAIIFLICSVPFPPALVIGCLVVGLACLIISISHALLQHKAHQEKIERAEAANPDKLAAFIAEVQAKEENFFVSEERINEIKISLHERTEESPPSEGITFWEWIRSFFSGWGKGLKVMEQCTGAQVQDPHDAPVLFTLSCGLGGCFAFILAGRAIARGYGRDSVDAIPKNPNEKMPIFVQSYPFVPNESLEKEGPDSNKWSTSDGSQTSDSECSYESEISEYSEGSDDEEMEYRSFEKYTKNLFNSWMRGGSPFFFYQKGSNQRDHSNAGPCFPQTCIGVNP